MAYIAPNQLDSFAAKPIVGSGFSMGTGSNLNVHGHRRGIPIDRFYIQKAIREYSGNIKGTVLEVGGNEYTRNFSKTDMTDSFILNYSPIEGNNVIIGDLTDCHSLKGLKFDTFIFS